MTPRPPIPPVPARRPWSLRTQIAVVFGSLVSVVALLLSLAFGELLKLRAQHEAAAALHMVGHNAAKVMAEELFERSRLVQVLASSQDLWDKGLGAQDLLPLLQRMHTSRPYSRWIGVADVHGIVQTDSNHMFSGQDVSAAPGSRPASRIRTSATSTSSRRWPNASRPAPAARRSVSSTLPRPSSAMAKPWACWACI
ncbi:hypothetical protein ACFQOZ_13145 [Comamonas endophytica]|uniref:hypothetical protein n=1 Tax=Comamonas endophytica TaxID=2949090 RepID=UPI0036193213